MHKSVIDRLTSTSIHPKLSGQTHCSIVDLNMQQSRCTNFSTAQTQNPTEVCLQCSNDHHDVNTRAANTSTLLVPCHELTMSQCKIRYICVKIQEIVPKSRIRPVLKLLRHTQSKNGILEIWFPSVSIDYNNHTLGYCGLNEKSTPHKGLNVAITSLLYLHFAIYHSLIS